MWLCGYFRIPEPTVLHSYRAFAASPLNYRENGAEYPCSQFQVVELLSDERRVAAAPAGNNAWPLSGQIFKLSRLRAFYSSGSFKGLWPSLSRIISSYNSWSLYCRVSSFIATQVARWLQSSFYCSSLLPIRRSIEWKTLNPLSGQSTVKWVVRAGIGDMTHNPCRNKKKILRMPVCLPSMV